MPKITLEVLCDVLPENRQKFESNMQQSLSCLNPEYILVGVDYNREDAEIEQLLYQSYQSIVDEDSRGAAANKDVPTEKDYLLNLRILKH